MASPRTLALARQATAPVLRRTLTMDRIYQDSVRWSSVLRRRTGPAFEVGPPGVPLQEPWPVRPSRPTTGTPAVATCRHPGGVRSRSRRWRSAPQPPVVVRNGHVTSLCQCQRTMFSGRVMYACRNTYEIEAPAQAVTHDSARRSLRGEARAPSPGWRRTTGCSVP